MELPPREWKSARERGEPTALDKIEGGTEWEGFRTWIWRMSLAAVILSILSILSTALPFGLDAAAIVLARLLRLALRTQPRSDTRGSEAELSGQQVEQLAVREHPRDQVGADDDLGHDAFAEAAVIGFID